MSPLDATTPITAIVEDALSAALTGKRFLCLPNDASPEQRATAAASRRRTSRAATKAFKAPAGTPTRSKPFVAKPDISAQVQAKRRAAAILQLATKIAVEHGLSPTDSIARAADTLRGIEQQVAAHAAAKAERASRTYPTCANEDHWNRPSMDGIRFPIARPVSEWRVQWKPKIGWVGGPVEMTAATTQEAA